jgi:hypothetical protein
MELLKQIPFGVVKLLRELQVFLKLLTVQTGMSEELKRIKYFSKKTIA